MRPGIQWLITTLIWLAVPASASAQSFDFPGFTVRDLAVNGATIHTRSGGSGPAVVLLHGYGETGDMWAPMAADLARDHTVVVPDLRGLGLSSKPPAGLDERPSPRRSGTITGDLASGRPPSAPTCRPSRHSRG